MLRMPDPGTGIMNRYFLDSWHYVVSRKVEFLRIQEDSHGEISVRKFKSLPFGEKISGVFAYYPEGLFMIWNSKDKGYCLAFGRKVVSLSNIAKISLVSENQGKRFSAYGWDDSVLLSFSYYTTLGRLLREPVWLILDVIVPDDDWWLVADLPGEFQSVFNRGLFENWFGQILHQAARKYNAI